MSNKMRLCCGVMLLGVAAALGCNQPKFDRVPVSGRVLVDGEPLTYGYVRVYPDGARASGGRLDEQGRFVLTSKKKGDGVVSGTHPVSVSAGEPLTETTIKWHAPKKYNTPQTSGLEVTVDEPTDSLVINLTWDGEEPFVERQTPGGNR